MKTAIVVGGGWAGLSCSVFLARAGWRVTLLEQSGRLGGRASSFRDPETGDTIDNGQHLFMGCYTHTFDFLDATGSLAKLKFQKGLSVDFVDKNARVSSLRCANWPAPFHLFGGLLRLPTLTWRDKLAALTVYRQVLRHAGNGALRRLTVDEWLARSGQSPSARRHFWDLITLATLNEQPSVAEADALAVVLKAAFFTDKNNSRVAVAADGLSAVCGPGTEAYLNARGGEVRTGQLVSRIDFGPDSVRGLALRDGRRLAADLYVSAVPFFALGNLLGAGGARAPFFAPMGALQSSPIFSVSLWFDRAVAEGEFYGLLDTEVQWLFNKSRLFPSASRPGYVALVISGARRFLAMSDREILRLCLDELRACFPASRGAALRRWLIQREKNATLSPRVGYGSFRLPQKTPYKNFYLAGDWTDTGLPATIESAVLSAKNVAQAAG